MSYFQYIIFIIFASVLITTLLHRRYNIHRRIAFSALIISGALLALDLPQLLSENIITYNMLGWAPPLGIVLVLDKFSYAVASLVIISGLGGLMLTKGEIKEERMHYYSLYMLLVLGMFGVSVTGDIFNLFVFMEILSIASYGLASYNDDRDSIGSSIMYLILGAFSTSLILLGIAIIYGATGTLNMAEISLFMSQPYNQGALAAVGLLLSGLSFKAAIAPFHAWKPSVITNTPFSAGLLFTAGGTTVGLYAIYRLISTIAVIDMGGLLVLLGVPTMALGALLAIKASNIKTLLAYSAISQSGYVLLALGLGAFGGALFHMLNIVIIDILLFSIAYLVVSKARTCNLDDLRGIIKEDQFLFVSSIIAISSLAGIPFFNGFSSKLLIYNAGLEMMPLAAFSAMVVSVLTLAYGYKILNIFMSPAGKDMSVRISSGIRILIIILSVACISLGVFQESVYDILEMIVSSSGGKIYILEVLGR